MNCQITGTNASSTVTNYSMSVTGNVNAGPSNFSNSQVVRCTSSAYTLQFLCNGYTVNNITGYYTATRIA